MIDIVWERIIDNEGETFKQIKGGEFTYSVNGNKIDLSRTTQSIYKKSFQEALKLVPLENTTPLQKSFRAPSYIFAIVMDKRIRKTDW
ncbi:hypothetical protein [Bacillus piscicola]|uniref:hypothetical protein n=1 Tax=Bacillus piscicola TaxID=1632684 RepID=UPI001F089693